MYNLNNYKNQAISTMTGPQLITELYDGLVKNINLTIQLYNTEDYAMGDECIKKAKDIVNYLSKILDRKYEVSQELDKYYYFIKEKLTDANIYRKTDDLEELLPIIKDLREVWMEVENSVKKEKVANGR